MLYIFRRSLVIAAVFLSVFIAAATVRAEPLSFKSSTQFLWGDDLLGEDQAILAQYLRLGYNPEGRNYSVAGYGRLMHDFGNGVIRDNGFEGRLYYLYLDYSPMQNISTRLGRQFINFTADAAIMDGAKISLRKLGPVGVTLAGGRDVKFALDTESSRAGNYFLGLDIHLEDVRSTQLGVSYVRKYDSGDLAREEVGMNFRYFYRFLSPYAEVRYDHLSKAIDEATVGLDLFPISNLMVKAEFYHSYPTFDATSIYSVFAVNRFREYLVRAEYSLNVPVTLFASYARQTYEDSVDADVYTGGARLYPTEDLTLSASVDYRRGYSGYNGASGETDGRLFGFEVTADYRIRKELAVFAGVQYDTYKRPELTGDNYASRYWAGGRWMANRNLFVSARVETNVNENFEHRTLGRVTLDWNL